MLVRNIEGGTFRTFDGQSLSKFCKSGNGLTHATHRTDFKGGGVEVTKLEPRFVGRKKDTTGATWRNVCFFVTLQIIVLKFMRFGSLRRKSIRVCRINFAFLQIQSRSSTIHLFIPVFQY
jgi:hypothetical protein